MPDLQSVIQGKPFVSSWSGGKDSCLALHRAVAAGGRPVALLTMLIEDGTRSRSHGLPLDVLEQQATALGVPLIARACSWNTYEAEFLSALDKAKGAGAQAAVFGDIDMQDHLDWVERTCARAGIAPCEPLWQEKRENLIAEFLGLGYHATIVVVRDGILDRTLLGKPLSPATVASIQAQGADASGERGEYHTVVTNGPLFRTPVKIRTGRAARHENCWVLDVRAADA